MSAGDALPGFDVVHFLRLRFPRVTSLLVLGAVLVAVLGAVLPTLIWGGFSFQYWIVTVWLLPLPAIFCLTCCVLGAVALGRRLWRFRRAGQATVAPVRPRTAVS
ncbi:hypothetical protein ACWDLG_12705 [Nonomuraea sp. NPDC003727]